MRLTAAIYCGMLLALGILCWPREDLIFMCKSCSYWWWFYRFADLKVVSFQSIFAIRVVVQLVGFIPGVFSLLVCAVVSFRSGVSMEEFKCQKSYDFCMGSLTIPIIKLSWIALLHGCGKGAVLHFPVFLHERVKPKVFHYSISIIFIGSQLGWNNSLGLRYYYVDFSLGVIVYFSFLKWKKLSKFSFKLNKL